MVEREAKAQRFDTLQLPDTADLKELGMFPLRNNRFELIRLIPGANDTRALDRVKGLTSIPWRHSDGFSSVRMCHVPYQTGWRHDRPCPCDEDLPQINCGARRWRAVVGKGWRPAYPRMDSDDVHGELATSEASTSVESWTRSNFWELCRNATWLPMWRVPHR